MPTGGKMNRIISQCSDCDVIVVKKFFVNNPLCEVCLKKYPKHQQIYANKKNDYQPERTSERAPEKVMRCSEHSNERE